MTRGNWDLSIAYSLTFNGCSASAQSGAHSLVAPSAGPPGISWAWAMGVLERMITESAGMAVLAIEGHKKLEAAQQAMGRGLVCNLHLYPILCCPQSFPCQELYDAFSACFKTVGFFIRDQAKSSESFGRLWDLLLPRSMAEVSRHGSHMRQSCFVGCLDVFQRTCRCA